MSVHIEAFARVDGFRCGKGACGEVLILVIDYIDVVDQYIRAVYYRALDHQHHIVAFELRQWHFHSVPAFESVVAGHVVDKNILVSVAGVGRYGDYVLHVHTLLYGAVVSGEGKVWVVDTVNIEFAYGYAGRVAGVL